MLELVSSVTLSLPVLMLTSLLLPGKPALQSAALLQLPVPPSQLSCDEGVSNLPLPIHVFHRYELLEDSG